jgi:hypothetical protein
MTSTRWGFFVASLGLVLVPPPLIGGDSSTAAVSGESRTVAGTEPTLISDTSVSEHVSALNVPVPPGPVVGREQTSQAKSSAKVRRAVLEPFSYHPSAPQKSSEQSSPVLVLPQQEAAEPDVVVMAKFEVAARAYERGLPAAIANWRDPKPQNDSRFGTGIHQKDFGKVRASVVTILYVPIVFGISW